MGPASRNFCSAAVPFSGEHDLTARGPCFIPAVNRFKHFSVNLHITAFFFQCRKSHSKSTCAFCLQNQHSLQSSTGRDSCIAGFWDSYFRFSCPTLMTNTCAGSERDATACIASNCASSNLLLGCGCSRQESCIANSPSQAGWGAEEQELVHVGWWN